MTGEELDVDGIADALRVNVGLLVRRLRQAAVAHDELSLPETSALARLDRGGPMSAAELARLERISPQSIGTTVAALQARGLVTRTPDPGDGRRALLSISDAGLAVLRDRRGERTQRIAHALGSEFTPEEREQLAAAAVLLERLAQHV